MLKPVHAKSNGLRVPAMASEPRYYPHATKKRLESDLTRPRSQEHPSDVDLAPPPDDSPASPGESLKRVSLLLAL